jgi:biopolymer transport protein ExbB
MPEWFVKGGIAMWPILVCSIVGLAIIIERVWALQRKQIISSDLVKAIQTQPQTPEATNWLRSLADGDKSVLGELVRTTFRHANVSKEENAEAISAAARQISGRLERGLTTLALIAELGPLLGLLGTVNGMVRLFADVATHGLAEPGMISKGISEALHATFFGLGIAIPALVAYMYLRRRIDNLSLEMERHVNDVLTRLYR